MKFAWATGFFLLLTLLSCTNRDRVPGGVIVPDSMQVIMHDLVIADQFVSQYLLKDSLKRDVEKESQDLYDKLFAVHGTTREAFHESLAFYATRPDLERLIFDSLASGVARERTAIYKEKYGVRDSLAKKSSDSIALLRAGPPPLNPDSLKKMILSAHPGIPMAVLMDSLNIRLKKRAAEDSVRRATRILDSTAKHISDSLHLKKVADSIRRKNPVPARPFPSRPGAHAPAPVK